MSPRSRVLEAELAEQQPPRDPLSVEALRELVDELIGGRPVHLITEKPLAVLIVSVHHPRPLEHLLERWADGSRTERETLPHQLAARAAVPAETLVVAADAVQRARKVIAEHGRIVVVRAMASSAWAIDTQARVDVQLLEVHLTDRDFVKSTGPGIR